MNGLHEWMVAQFAELRQNQIPAEHRQFLFTESLAEADAVSGAAWRASG
jgi:hypothetical protein